MDTGLSSLKSNVEQARFPSYTFLKVKLLGASFKLLCIMSVMTLNNLFLPTGGYLPGLCY